VLGSDSLPEAGMVKAWRWTLVPTEREFGTGYGLALPLLSVRSLLP
jgi:hypothetical protein